MARATQEMSENGAVFVREASTPAYVPVPVMELESEARSAA